MPDSTHGHSTGSTTSSKSARKRGSSSRRALARFVKAVGRMARPLRIQEAGLIYHVHARGTGRMAIYVDDTDRLDFLDLLADVVDSHALICHGYCLMTTHYHLVVTTAQANLSRAVHHINGRYAQRWNRRHGRVGHVFQGRFGARIVQGDHHFTTICRYLALNPVRAALVSAPEMWPWSSYGATVGLCERPPFLDTRTLLGHFGRPERTASARAFRAFVASSAADEGDLPDGPVLGDAEFVARFRPRARLASREVPGAERHLRPALADVFAGAVTRTERAACMARACALGFSRAEVARFLGVHPATVSKAVLGVRGVRS
jgi:putative transposase